jgi:hypothetical protein
VKTIRRRVTEDVDFSKTPATVPKCTPDIGLTFAAAELQLQHCFSLFLIVSKIGPNAERHTRISKRINYCWAGEEPLRVGQISSA